MDSFTSNRLRASSPEPYVVFEADLIPQPSLLVSAAAQFVEPTREPVISSDEEVELEANVQPEAVCIVA